MQCEQEQNGWTLTIKHKDCDECLITVLVYEDWHGFYEDEQHLRHCVLVRHNYPQGQEGDNMV